MKTTNKQNLLMVTDERRQIILRLTAFAVVFFFMMDNDLLAQSGAIGSKITAVQAWLKPIIHGVLGLFCLVKLGQVVYKFFFVQREAGADFMWLIIGLAFWGMFIGFSNEIFNLFGGSGNAVN